MKLSQLRSLSFANYSHTFGNYVLLALGQAVFALLSTRWLMPEFRGQLMLLLVTANSLLLLATGGTAIEGRRLLSKKDPTHESNYLHSFAIVGIAAFFLATTLGTFVLWISNSLVGIQSVTFVVSLAISQSWMFVARSGLLGIRRYAAVSRMAATATVLLVGGICVLGYLDAVTYTNAALVQVCSSLCVSVIAYRSLRKCLTVEGGSYREAWIRYRQSFKAVFSNLSFFASKEMDRLLLGIVSGPMAVAFYGVGVTANSVSTWVGSASSQIIQTEASYTKKTRFQRQEWLTLALVIVGSTVLIAIAPSIIIFVFGSEYSEAIPVTRVAAIAAIFWTIQNMQLARRQGSGKHREIAFNALVGTVLVALLVPLLAYFYGALGCAFAMLFTSIAMCCFWKPNKSFPSGKKTDS